MRIFILDSQNVQKSIYIMESDTVSELKNQTKSKFNINNDIELIYNGILLMDDDQQLQEIGIKDGATVNYLGKFNAGFNKNNKNIYN